MRVNQLFRKMVLDTSALILGYILCYKMSFNGAQFCGLNVHSYIFETDILTAEVSRSSTWAQRLLCGWCSDPGPNKPIGDIIQCYLNFLKALTEFSHFAERQNIPSYLINVQI